MIRRLRCFGECVRPLPMRTLVTVRKGVVEARKPCLVEVTADYSGVEAILAHLSQMRPVGVS